MALTQMYDGKNNSPQTALSANITADDSVIPVSDISVFPSAPNLATIGNDDNAEVIRYTGISGSTLTNCERGFGGTTKKSWDAETVISRQITKYDFDAIQGNITERNTAKQETYSADATKWDTTPTASSTKPVTSGGLKTYIDSRYIYTSVGGTGGSKASIETALTQINALGLPIEFSYPVMMYFTSTNFTGAYTGTLNFTSTSVRFLIANELYIITGLFLRASNTISTIKYQPDTLYFYNLSTSTTSTSTTEFCGVSDSRINSDTVLVRCEYTVPSAITSGVKWVSTNGSPNGHFSLQGICTSNTCKVNLVLAQKGN